MAVFCGNMPTVGVSGIHTILKKFVSMVSNLNVFILQFQDTSQEVQYSIKQVQYSPVAKHTFFRKSCKKAP